jgi:hypothetical protein
LKLFDYKIDLSNQFTFQLNIERMEPLITETLQHGSLYELLYSRLVTSRQVLEILLKEKNETKDTDVRINRIINYNILCRLSKNHIVNGKHFLTQTNNEDYLVTFEPYLERLDGEDRLDIIQRLDNINRSHDIELFRIIYLLNGARMTDMENGEDSMPEDGDDYYLAKVRNREYKDFYFSDVDACINADYLFPLQNYSNPIVYMNELIKRIKFLKRNASLYWEKVGFHTYSNFLSQHVKKLKFKSKICKFLKKEFPLIYQDCKDRSELGYQLLNLPLASRAYYLGFPIHLYIPNENTLEKAIDRLEEIGIEKYCHEVLSEYSLQSLKNSKVSNEQNVEYENFEDYNPFDVCCYYTDTEETKQIFKFSRNEFDKLLKDKINFYTRQPLPFSLITEITQRISVAKAYNLPDCKTLKDLLNNLSKGLQPSRQNLQPISSPHVRNTVTPHHHSNRQDNEENGGEDRIIVVNAIKRSTGERGMIRLRMPPLLENETLENEDDLIRRILNSKGFDFLGRVEHSCHDCGRDISPEELAALEDYVEEHGHIPPEYEDDIDDTEEYDEEEDYDEENDQDDEEEEINIEDLEKDLVD